MRAKKRTGSWPSIFATWAALLVGGSIAAAAVLSAVESDGFRQMVIRFVVGL